jgi:putative Holliday junction resolvase
LRIAIGLDVGTLTIGVAASDGIGMLAHPWTTLARQGVRKDCDALIALFAEREVGRIVVGMPYELDGSEARSARLARQIGEALATRTGLEVSYVDERFTSVEAERRLIEAGRSRAKRKLTIDQAAAAVILQSWLDDGGRTALQAAAAGPPRAEVPGRSAAISGDGAAAAKEPGGLGVAGAESGRGRAAQQGDVK